MVIDVFIAIVLCVVTGGQRHSQGNFWAHTQPRCLSMDGISPIRRACASDVRVMISTPNSIPRCHLTTALATDRGSFSSGGNSRMDTCVPRMGR